MDKLRRADKAKAEEKRRSDKATALKRDEKVEQKAEEQANAANTKLAAVQ